MPWFKELLDSISCLDESKTDEATCEELSKHMPESFTLGELQTSVQEAVHKAELSKTKNTRQTKSVLLTILACLQQTPKIQPISDEDQDSADALALNISQLIAPIIPPSKDDDTKLNAAFNENLTESVAQQVQHSLAVSNLGIKALSALTRIISTQLHPEVILTLISFADPSQEWTPTETSELATEILIAEFSIHHHRKEEFIPKQILQTYLRPLFSKSKPASVTSSGRKAAYPEQSQDDGGGIPDDTSATKPWKFTDLRAIPIVSWAVTEADDTLISSSWPLYIPVLLTLTDDNSTPIRARGLRILNTFLEKFPTKTLSDTGLNKVFEDAIFPTLTYLPSLTPVDESVQLLNPAYEALLTLASKTSSPNPLLDKIIRQGILEAHFHAKEHLRIVQVLNTQTVKIVNMMGIHAVKHLKDIIPSLVVTALTDPFAPASPELLLSAIKTLQAILTNCWPRIPAHQDEILNALVLCWLNVSSSSSSSSSGRHPLPEVEKELITSSRLLSAVLDSKETSLSQLVSPLIQKEPSLARLFSASASAEETSPAPIPIQTQKQDSQHP
ncbi:hypothetical protein QBC44DRAFT_393364 [Cladorrhinum sp. PSN332]|nr:hypothetical protein QBC44DRAFT_393364 [Cladorrhinum sp. PSN332]